MIRPWETTRLTDAGCDMVEVAAITGHASLKVLEVNIKTRNRKNAARRAMRAHIGNRSGNPNYPVCQFGRKTMTNQRHKMRMAPRAGFEPATNRLTAGCSTAELPGNSLLGVVRARI